jgi:zinc transporter
VTSHVLFAYRFDGKGGGEALPDEQVAKEIKADTLAWVHLNVDHPDTKPWLERELSYLEPFVIDALLMEETRPRAVEVGKGVLVILRGVNLNENARPEDMISIRLWIDGNRIISLQKRQLKAVKDVAKAIESGYGPKNSGEFLTALISRLSERMEPVLDTLEDHTDVIEEQILEDPDITLRGEIIEVRRQAIILRRYIVPQRDVTTQLSFTKLAWIDATQKRQLQENSDRITRYVEHLDAVRERTQIIKDELSNIIAERLNKNTYMLSVIAAIFLPLGFLTGLLGINVGGIPGAENDTAFVLFCGGLLLIAVLQVIIFKRLKWF